MISAVLAAIFHGILIILYLKASKTIQSAVGSSSQTGRRIGVLTKQLAFAMIYALVIMGAYTVLNMFIQEDNLVFMTAITIFVTSFGMPTCYALPQLLLLRFLSRSLRTRSRTLSGRRERKKLNSVFPSPTASTHFESATETGATKIGATESRTTSWTDSGSSESSRSKEAWSPTSSESRSPPVSTKSLNVHPIEV